MLATADEIAGLVDDAWLAEAHQLFCLLERYLLLKLITAQSPILRWPFNSKVPARVTDSYPDGTSVTARDITLLDAAAVESQSLEAVVPDEELAFYLQAAHQLTM